MFIYFSEPKKITLDKNNNNNESEAIKELGKLIGNSDLAKEAFYRIRSIVNGSSNASLVGADGELSFLFMMKPILMYFRTSPKAGSPTALEIDSSFAQVTEDDYGKNEVDLSHIFVKNESAFTSCLNDDKMLDLFRKSILLSAFSSLNNFCVYVFLNKSQREIKESVFADIYLNAVPKILKQNFSYCEAPARNFDSIKFYNSKIILLDSEYDLPVLINKIEKKEGYAYFNFMQKKPVGKLFLKNPGNYQNSIIEMLKNDGNISELIQKINAAGRNADTFKYITNYDNACDTLIKGIKDL